MSTGLGIRSLQCVYLCSNRYGGESYDKEAKVLEMRARVGTEDGRYPPVPQVQERVLERAEENTTEQKDIG